MRFAACGFAFGSFRGFAKPQAAIVIAAMIAFSPSAGAQIISYPDPSLDYVYPAGGQRGQSVTVEFGGLNGLTGAKNVLIDGPPGVTVKDVQAVNHALAKATLVIAPDAPVGRRYLRLVGGANGLTNFRYFFVGNLSEAVEKESNDSLATAQEVAVPVVVNGRIEKELDIDCFRFAAKKGQRLVLSVFAHGMDSTQRLRSFNQGFLDTSLELLDDAGRVLAAADDSIGLDPVIDHVAKADGTYIVRVQSLGYKGSPTSVYRLTIGDVPVPRFAFPPGGKRGAELDLELGGIQIPANLRHKAKLSPEGSCPLAFLPLGQGPSDGRDLALVRGDYSEVNETEANDDAKTAMPLKWPVTVNGRIDRSDDIDWFRVSLKKGQGIIAETMAQRLLRSPLDTVLEVYDAAGKKLAENDDGLPFMPQCAHEFNSADSWLAFTAPADGDYLVRLRDQSGAGGKHAVYRLTVSDYKPDFRLYQWPDAVPIWGPGTSATFVVECYHWGGLKGEMHLRVEGLPPGWTGSVVNWSVSSFGVYPVPNGTKAILTITAPKDVPLGATAPFRVVGKLVDDKTTLEREAEYLTLYGNGHNDRMLLRSSPQARAVVADYMDAWPVTEIKELTGAPGETLKIPVKIQRKPGSKGDIGLVVNGPTVAAGCGLGPPQSVTAGEDEYVFPLKLSAELRPGTIGIVVARSWSSDLRAGRPGPCTPLIHLHVRDPKK